MGETEIRLTQLAALADCIEGVNIDRVSHYRQKLATGKKIDPIRVCGINCQGFYVISDGNHRTLAYALEGYNLVPAEIDQTLNVLNISWRWPRIAPIVHTIELIKML